MTTQMLTNRAEKRDAPAERGGRNLPMAAEGASSGTARKGYGTVRTMVWEDGGREPSSYPMVLKNLVL